MRYLKLVFLMFGSAMLWQMLPKALFAVLGVSLGEMATAWSMGIVPFVVSLSIGQMEADTGFSKWRRPLGWYATVMLIAPFWWFLRARTKLL